VRELLRSLPVFAGVIGDFDVDARPDDPTELFRRWLGAAIDDGVIEPHAMTLSTIDAAGMPDARTLILKDLDDAGWWFATNADSAKGRQLATRPVAALTFYWPSVGRQIRVRGAVMTGSADAGAADFRARGTAAQAVALASPESEPLADRATCADAIAEAAARLAADPDLVARSWSAYAVVADTVEFWSAGKDRQHLRVQYRRHDAGWTHTLLWP
jgi:pyridoxamine 5'-phosphate oxidase